MGHSKFYNIITTFHLLPTLSYCLYLPGKVVPHPPCIPSSLFFLSWTEEPVKTSTCACDRRMLQQLALNVHVKHSDQISYRRLPRVLSINLHQTPCMCWIHCLFKTRTCDQHWATDYQNLKPVEKQMSS